MEKFKEDLKLLVELDVLIKQKEKTANLNPNTQAAAKMLMPGLAKFLPLGQESAKAELDILYRVKNRLEELIEELRQ